MEESGLDLTKAEKLTYSGVVLWAEFVNGEETVTGGMHAYIATFEDESVVFDSRATREGNLEWKPISWILDESNVDVVSNVPLFLSHMMKHEEPHEHCFVYNRREIVRHKVRKLS